MSKSKADDELLANAREEFAQGQAADYKNILLAEQDLLFLAGNQWNDTERQARETLGRPCLTINRLPQFVGQVIGDIRQNKPSIKIRALADKDTEAADCRQGLIRTIEQANNAPGVYSQAGEDAVACGLGWFRAGLEYASDDVFDQDIYIRPGENPLAVIWDPSSIEPTGKDAQYCFVSDMIPRKEFEAKYKGQSPSSLNPNILAELQSSGWVTTDRVRVTEYWRMKSVPAELGLLPDGSVIDLNDPKNSQVLPTVVRKRKTARKVAERWMITGFSILEGPYELPITRLPIIRVQGRVIRLGEIKYRFGLVRFAKDAQRIFNYARSTLVEMVAKSPKNQWLASQRSIEGQEKAFRTAATSGDPLLIYNDAGNSPVLQPPPVFPTAFAQLAELHAQDMKDVTGLHDASLGAQSNETSGKAIMARERQGDVATYVYIDNLHSAVEACGCVVNELINVAYDAQRTVLITGEDGSTEQKEVNAPDPANPGQIHPDSIDLTAGKYHVTIDVGPSYTTKRVEAAESMMQFVQSYPAAAPAVADLIAKAQDWPMAEQFAERLRAVAPPPIQALIAQENGGQPTVPPPPPDPMQVELAKAHLSEAQAKALKAHAELATEHAKSQLIAAQAEKAMFEAGALNGQAMASLTSEIVGDQQAPDPSMMGQDASGQQPSPAEPPAPSDADPMAQAA
jgi:hypothetical protein